MVLKATLCNGTVAIAFVGWGADGVGETSVRRHRVCAALVVSSNRAALLGEYRFAAPNIYGDRSVGDKQSALGLRSATTDDEGRGRPVVARRVATSSSRV